VDNVTHTLVGLIIGEPVAAHATHAVPRERGLPVQTRRTALLSVALLGSNSPDLDLLVSFRGSSTGRLLFALAVVGAVVLGLATGLMSGLSCFALAVGFLLLARKRLAAVRKQSLAVERGPRARSDVRLRPGGARGRATGAGSRAGRLSRRAAARLRSLCRTPRLS
jgi:hypothetical protein